MTVLALVEDDLEFYFNNAISAIRFDDDGTHGNNTMKRVDFIAEYADRYIFIEVKDPDNPVATNPEAFRGKLIGGNLIPDLAGKYRDSLCFHTLCGKTEKPIYYVVLLSMTALEPALLLNKQDELHRCLPMSHISWSKKAAEGCLILNLTQYKEYFGATSVRRISEGSI